MIIIDLLYTAYKPQKNRYTCPAIVIQSKTSKVSFVTEKPLYLYAFLWYEH